MWRVLAILAALNLFVLQGVSASDMHGDGHNGAIVEIAPLCSASTDDQPSQHPAFDHCQHCLLSTKKFVALVAILVSHFADWSERVLGRPPVMFSRYERSNLIRPPSRAPPVAS